MTQTKAEQLADALMLYTTCTDTEIDEAADELRRLSPMEADAKRYQWLKTRLLGADFK